MNDYIIKSLIELAFTIISGVVTVVLLPAVAAWLKSKTDNERIKAVITDITETVATCVDHCEQTPVSALKASDSWNKEAQEQVLQTVTANVIDNLLATTKDIIEKNNIDINTLVVQHIESYIQSKKTKETE